MKAFFNKLFNVNDTQENKNTQQHQQQLITATLLVEVSKADFSIDDKEYEKINDILQSHFNLSPQETQLLTQLATEHSDKIVSLQHMTRELNESLSQQEKVSIIELMWDIVYADGIKDRFEEQLMRKVSDLLYIDHADFIKARHKAESNT